MQSAKANGVLGPAEVATLLGVSVSTVHRWAEAHVIPCVEVGGPERPRRLFSRAAIEDFAKNGPEMPPARSPAPFSLADLLAELASGEAEIVVTIRRTRGQR